LVNINDRRKKQIDHKYRILVVEDDLDSGLYIKMTLEQSGFQVDTFNDPLQVIQNFKVNFYDLLIFDIKMPNMNGFELYELLKEFDKSIKVCFITGFEPYYRSLVEQFNLDVVCFIKKPISGNDLIKHVFKHMMTLK
jgi:DNA-binding response OmpR family regulator